MTEESKISNIQKLVITHAVKATVYGMGILLLWAITKAYSLDERISSENTAIKAEMVRLHNELVEKMADIVQKQSDLEGKMAIGGGGLPPLPPLPLGPRPGNEPPDPSQHGLEFYKKNLKK